ncbi:hypothetical protein E5676_scaffold1185G00190 [Cucumis melo var. makuwa]|uniref:Uncharacterized protein n=1 Tax=Cucumis melo var. makuwa TaxID=1194695 RepID=A0A5D3DR51_CUCMM|nr:hypothetical protein E6C27_scaffold238G00300 [Cucumis melo var. makuwa]TYK26064.1 hypothetical protein E5676_scaffold1185G00190 [Cucumis melo var. makuwa]
MSTSSHSNFEPVIPPKPKSVIKPPHVSAASTFVLSHKLSSTFQPPTMSSTRLLRYLFVSRSDWVPPTSDVAASVAPIAPLTTLMSDAPGDSFSPSCYSNVESAHLDSSFDIHPVVSRATSNPRTTSQPVSSFVVTPCSSSLYAMEWECDHLDILREILHEVTHRTPSKQN